MSRIPDEKDGGEINLMDKLMDWGIVFHKHTF